MRIYVRAHAVLRPHQLFYSDSDQTSSYVRYGTDLHGKRLIMARATRPVLQRKQRNESDDWLEEQRTRHGRRHAKLSAGV